MGSDLCPHMVKSWGQKCDLSSDQRSPGVSDEDVEVGVLAEDLAQCEGVHLGAVAGAVRAVEQERVREG